MKRVALVIGPYAEMNDAICKRLAKLDYEVSAADSASNVVSPGRCSENLPALHALIDAMDTNTSVDVCISHVAMPNDLRQKVAAQMAARGWGRIVDIDLVDAVPKAAVVKSGAEQGKAIAIAPELLAAGVTINTIVTGDVAPKDDESQDQSASRLNKIEEIAGLAAYLASDEAGFLSGARIAFDTGRRLR